MEGASGITRSIIDEPHSSEIQGDQMEGASGVNLSVLQELILRISEEIKCMVKGVLVQVSSMNFILGISEEMK